MISSEISEPRDEAGKGPSPRAGDHGTRGRRYMRVVAIGITLGLLLSIYFFYGSAGRAGAWPIYTTYHDELADAFRAGQLHLLRAPPPELLAQADPYDPAHLRLWLWDVSLHRGRYYLYWGPVPALLQALAKSALRIDGAIGDQYLVCAMFFLAAVAAALLLERLQRRVFAAVPLWCVLLGILAFGCITPTLFLVATGGVYQASIAAAQAFLLLGMVFAFDAVWGASGAEPLPRRLALAGGCWALALGSRISVAPAIALLVLLTAAFSARSAAPRGLGTRAAFRASVWMAAPVAITCGLLLLYNQLRFDSPFQFGTDLMLTTMKFRASTRYVLINAYSYLLRPFRTDCHFPFVSAPWAPPADEALPSWLEIPEGYLLGEPAVGVLRVVPIVWFAPIALLACVRALRGPRACEADPADEAARRSTGVAYCVLALAVLGTAAGLLSLAVFISTMRYQSDMMSGLSLLGLLGAFALLQRARGRLGRAVASLLFIATTVSTIGFGLLFGFQGYDGQFKRFHPTLHARLEHAWSRCD